MKKTISKKRKKIQSEDNDGGERDSSSSQSRRCNTKKRSADNCIRSKRYYNDTVPEETVRSSLPSELAEEYLSFVKRCGREKNEDDILKKCYQNSEKILSKKLQTDDDDKSSDHKGNLLVVQRSPKFGNSKKKGRRRKNTTKNLLKCLLCCEEFPTKQRKQEHYSEHFGPRGYECTFCAKAFDKMPALVSHVSRIHLIDKQLVCKICGKKFRREWLLRSHSLTHTSGRKFSCPTCKMGFTHKRHLFEHISGHVGFNPYKCEECGKRFQKSSYLSLHRKTHVSVRPFKCKLCDIQCSSYSAIEIHTLMHKENYGFECADCNVRVPLAMKSSHLICHNRKKNYLCELCPARFHAASTLKDHLRAHSCIREYECDVCEIVMKTARECSDHVCPMWQKSVIVICPICKLFIKGTCIEDHETQCLKKQKQTNLGDVDEVDEEDLWNDNGESVEKNNCNRMDRDSSCPSECTSDESDVDDVNGIDECSQNPSSLDSVEKKECLNLENGLLQQIKQKQSEVEVDTDDDDSDDHQYCQP